MAHVIRGGTFRTTAATDGIVPSNDWQAYWRKTDEQRRKASSWANGR